MEINKKITTVLVILAVIAMGAVIVATQRNTPSATVVPGAPSQTSAPTSASNPVASAPVTQQTIAGTVSAITASTLTIKGASETKELKINPGSYVYAMENNLPAAKSVKDLKVGSKVAVQYNGDTSQVISIFLQK